MLSEHGSGSDPGSFVLSEVLSDGSGGFCQDPGGSVRLECAVRMDPGGSVRIA